MSALAKKTPYSGFTLIELMIVVAIVAILAAIALPSYKSYIVKTRRADVQGELTKWAQSLERYNTTNGRYVTAPAGNTCGVDAPTGTPSNNGYTFTTSTCGDNVFDLKAVPATGSTQAGDGNQELTNTGARTGKWAN